MQISARNILKGKITKIVEGPVSTEVTIKVGPKAEIVSSITSTAARSLGLKKGSEAYAIIKATSVMVGVDD
ncbi:MAG: molybdopterin-binding protein [Burkholderiales bacterium]